MMPGRATVKVRRRRTSMLEPRILTTSVNFSYAAMARLSTDAGAGLGHGASSDGRRRSHSSLRACGPPRILRSKNPQT